MGLLTNILKVALSSSLALTTSASYANGYNLTRRKQEETNEIEDIGESLGLDDEQRNSISMLYYLSFIAEDIRASKDNRLMLDDIYTSLLNDTNPGAIDETTQEHLQNLRDIIKQYIGVSTKRERLQYLYNKEKSDAIRSAVPDPIAILSTVNSLDWKKLAFTLAYTVVDSCVKYKNASDAADLNYLVNGWELDDVELKAIQDNRERAYNYMVDIVQEKNIDGKLTINEKAISKFAEICKIENVDEKIQRLTAEKDTYVLLGNYWVELATCYFEKDDYMSCLNCVQQYMNLSNEIYRKDANLVKILPMAIVSTQNLYSGNTYISNNDKFAKLIQDNSDTEDWSVNYFVAQVYMDLYNKTKDKKYIKNAYTIAKNNVTVLLDKQRALNSEYLSDLQEIKVEEPDYSYMSKKEQEKAKAEYNTEKENAKKYNKELKEKRKTELPSLYEPLELNCELLFALADQLKIDDKEKSSIEGILQTSNNGIFISDPINQKYSFSKIEKENGIKFTLGEIDIPANLLFDGCKITITVKDNGEKTKIDDCVINEVDRKGNDISSFIAIITSDKLREYDWTENSEVTMTVYNGKEALSKYKYKVTHIENDLLQKIISIKDFRKLNDIPNILNAVEFEEVK